MAGCWWEALTSKINYRKCTCYTCSMFLGILLSLHTSYRLPHHRLKKNGSQSGHIVLLATRFILALFLFLSSFLFLLLPSLPPSPPPLVQGTGPMQPPPSLLTFLFPFPITPVRLTNPNTLPPAPPSSLGPNAPDPALYDSRTMG